MHTPSIRVGLVDITTSNGVKEDLGVGDEPTLVMYQGINELGRYEGGLTKADVESWAYGFTDAIPEVKELGLEDLTNAFGSDVPSIFLLRHYHDVDSDFVKEFRKASQYYNKEEILFYSNDII